MFGYVLPRRDRLEEGEARRYRAAYCGLCSSLKESYGFRGRFLVNYDMTFLYFLLSEQEDPEIRSCGCPARPFCKRECLSNDEVMSYCADLSVLLSYWKLRDAKGDGSFGKKLLAGMGLWLYKKAYGQAAQRQGHANEVFGTQLERLQKLEDSGCGSIDRPADAFASLLRTCAEPIRCPDRRRAAELLLYHVGRYLYLVDSLEDLPKDLKSGSYNPLALRYDLVEGALSQLDREQLTDTIEASISMAASAFELLEPQANGGILRNIIYFGLPSVLKSVNAGSFRKRRKKHERSL